MIVVIAFISIVTFIIALWLLRIVSIGAKAITISQDAVSTLRNDNYDDTEREKATQQASIKLLGIFFSILYRAILAFAAPWLPIWLADWLGWVKSEEVTAFLFRVDVILVSSILLSIIYFAGKRLWHSK